MTHYVSDASADSGLTDTSVRKTTTTTTTPLQKPAEFTQENIHEG